MRLLAEHPWLILRKEEIDRESGAPVEAYVLSGYPTGDLLVRDNLPPGTNLLENGLFFGTLNTEGTQDFQVRVTDSRGFFQEQYYSLFTTLDATKSINFITGKILESNLGLEYSKQLEVDGGNPPYFFSLLENNALPPGLALSSDGKIFGTPTLYSVSANIHQPFSSFIIKVTDILQTTRSKQFILKVNNESPIILSDTASDINKINILNNILEIEYPNMENRRSQYATLISTTSKFHIDLQAVSGGGIAKFRIDLGNDYIINDALLGGKSTNDALSEEVTFTTINELINNIGSTLQYFTDLLEYQKTQFIYENGNWKEA